MNAALGYTSVSSTTILSSMSGKLQPSKTIDGSSLLSSVSCTTGFFTLGVGACVGVEEFTAGKLGSVVLRSVVIFLLTLVPRLSSLYRNSIIGVFIVSQGDRDILALGRDVPKGPSSDPRLPTNPLLGDSLALASALAYAFYVVLLKVRIRNETRVSMTLFFGFVGLFNILLIWPLGLVLHFTKVEIWEWPHGGKLWASIAINAAITFVSYQNVLL